MVEPGCELREPGSRVHALLYWRGYCELNLPECSYPIKAMRAMIAQTIISLSVLPLHSWKHNCSGRGEERREYSALSGVPPKIDPLRTCERDLIWRKGLYRCN